MKKKDTEARFSFYKTHPKNCAADDFWGQVKRTVNGRPVSEEQIDIIVKEVSAGLDMQNYDMLLDICCGNGALSSLFFDQCRGGLGVDFSEILIDIAQKNFMKLGHDYLLADAFEFTRAPLQPERFTKILCYGSFAYLEAKSAKAILQNCYIKFPNALVFYIGNCPDKAHLHKFFRPENYVQGIEDDPASAIGIWRTKDEFASMAQAAGWSAEFKSMPEHFYASNYRYDVILRRSK